MMNQQYQTRILIRWGGKKGVCVTVSQNVCCIFTTSHILVVMWTALFSAHRWYRNMRKPQMARNMTYNPVSFPNTPTSSGCMCSSAVLSLPVGKQADFPSDNACSVLASSNITINKNSSHFADTVFNLSLRPPTHKHLNSQRICIDGPSEYWRAPQQRLYVKEHILSITLDNHRLQGGCTQPSAKPDIAQYSHDTNTKHTSVFFTTQHKPHNRFLTTKLTWLMGASFHFML